ncbi:MAG: BirA family biotin operon repressor/biotin-[acetyl-CoA-carboxylase] ligase [Saprospiraceae bacterium]|jgi:BirA family biotin operon repressor/biotin-[acetyl-CoA-carboxylase] ligase
MVNLSAQSTLVVEGASRFDVRRANRLMDASLCAWLSRIQYFEEIDSTNQELLRRTDSIHGRVCVADKQTHGRGRMGREWQGAQSPNIALSIGWQSSVELGSALSLVVGVAVAETLGAFGVTNVGLKWPNDILVDQQKLGGILIEAVNQGDSRRYVIGVGINLQLSESESERIDQAWTDLKRLGVTVDRTDLVGRLVDSVATAITLYSEEKMEPFRDKWHALHVFDGKWVKFVHGDETGKGKVLGVNDDGVLLMQVGDQQRSFVAGEIKMAF